MHSHDVLIVEDDAPLRQALCETLEANDFSVCSAADGSEALSVLDRGEVGIVPVDKEKLLADIEDDIDDK